MVGYAARRVCVKSAAFGVGRPLHHLATAEDTPGSLANRWPPSISEQPSQHTQHWQRVCLIVLHRCVSYCGIAVQLSLWHRTAVGIAGYHHHTTTMTGQQDGATQRAHQAGVEIPPCRRLPRRLYPLACATLRNCAITAPRSHEYRRRSRPAAGVGYPTCHDRRTAVEAVGTGGGYGGRGCGTAG